MGQNLPSVPPKKFPCSKFKQDKNLCEKIVFFFKIVRAIEKNGKKLRKLIYPCNLSTVGANRKSFSEL